MVGNMLILIIVDLALIQRWNCGYGLLGTFDEEVWVKSTRREHGADRRMHPTAEGRSVTVVDWLFHSDPSIRWQAMRDLTDAPAGEVAAERARVATEGWGARLLALRRADGLWDTGAPGTEEISLLALLMLRDMGLDPSSKEARDAIDRVRDNA